MWGIRRFRLQKALLCNSALYLLFAWLCLPRPMPPLVLCRRHCFRFYQGISIVFVGTCKQGRRRRSTLYAPFQPRRERERERERDRDRDRDRERERERERAQDEKNDPHTFGRGSCSHLGLSFLKLLHSLLLSCSQRVSLCSEQGVASCCLCLEPRSVAVGLQDHKTKGNYQFSASAVELEFLRSERRLRSGRHFA